MKFRRGFKTEANRISLRIRDALGLTPVCPIDPFLICEHFEIKVIGLSELSDDFQRRARLGGSQFSAVTVPRGNQMMIVHNDDQTAYRQRSNICHELAHSFLGHKHAPPLTADGDRHLDIEIENEATFLGGTLLMTNEAAYHVVKHGLLSSAQKHFGVSKDMLEFRLRMSGARTIYDRQIAKQRAQVG